MRKYLIAGLLALLIALPLGCSGYGTPASNTPATPATPAIPATPATPATANKVTISNLVFSPSSLTVAVGTTVTWTNKDSVAHTVTSDSGAFSSGSLAPNASFTYTFGTAGTYTYSCTVHPYMKGTIVVQ